MYCQSMMSEEHLNSFMANVLIIKRNQPINLQSKSVETGFYTTGTSAIKELMLCYLYVFIEMNMRQNEIIMRQNNQHLCIQISKEDAFN